MRSSNNTLMVEFFYFGPVVKLGGAHRPETSTFRWPTFAGYLHSNVPPVFTTEICSPAAIDYYSRKGFSKKEVHFKAAPELRSFFPLFRDGDLAHGVTEKSGDMRCPPSIPKSYPACSQNHVTGILAEHSVISQNDFGGRNAGCLKKVSE
jgi:hypothetical protein